MTVGEQAEVADAYKGRRNNVVKTIGMLRQFRVSFRYTLGVRGPIRARHLITREPSPPRWRAGRPATCRSTICSADPESERKDASLLHDCTANQKKLQRYSFTTFFSYRLTCHPPQERSISSCNPSPSDRH
jgi:hypothetical protein